MPSSASIRSSFSLYGPTEEPLAEEICWLSRSLEWLAGARLRLYKNFMKTLTITEAKKNLGRWLAAAARGDDIGIVSGADVIALRKVAVESADYAEREYGVTPDQVRALDEATDARYRRLKRTGRLITTNAEQLRKMLG